MYTLLISSLRLWNQVEINDSATVYLHSIINYKGESISNQPDLFPVDVPNSFSM